MEIFYYVGALCKGCDVEESENYEVRTKQGRIKRRKHRSALTSTWVVNVF